MRWAVARTVVAVLALAGLGLVRAEWAGPPAESPAAGARGPPAGCPAAVVAHRPPAAPRLVCAIATVELIAAVCPPSGAVHRGDRFTITGPRCRGRVEPLSAGHRLRLGLRVDVNDDTAAALARVKGIGPRTARRIVEGRPWASLDALEAVWGIGPRRLARIAPRLRASPRRRLWPSRPRHAASSLRRP